MNKHEEVLKIFSAKNDDHLFRCVSMHQVNEKLLADVQYYVLRSGIVYGISKDTLKEIPSGDKVVDLFVLEELGVYDEDKITNYQNDYIAVEAIFSLLDVLVEDNAKFTCPRRHL